MITGRNSQTRPEVHDDGEDGCVHVDFGRKHAIDSEGRSHGEEESVDPIDLILVLRIDNQAVFGNF